MKFKFCMEKILSSSHLDIGPVVRGLSVLGFLAALSSGSSFLFRAVTQVVIESKTNMQKQRLRSAVQFMYCTVHTDHCICFHSIDSKLPLLLKSKISSFCDCIAYRSVCVGPGWKTRFLGLLIRRLIHFYTPLENTSRFMEQQN